MDWSHYCSKFNYLSVPKKRHEISKNKNHSFCIKLFKLEWPADVFLKDNVSYLVRASLFDFKFKTFLGNQWNSSKIKNYKNVNDVFTLKLNENIYFHTSVIDESLVVIFEIIRYESEKAPISVGWSIFNIFKSTDNETSEIISIEIFKGTPRALLLMTDPPEDYPGLHKQEKSFIHLQFNINQSFDSCQFLVPENFLLHDNDQVPGLEMPRSGKTQLASPTLAKFINYIIENIKVVIQPSLLEFENNFHKLLNVDRLLRDNVTKNKDPGSLEIVERRLRIGVHNGYTFVDDNETVYLNVHDPMVKSSRSSHTVKSATGDANSLKAKNAIEVSLPVNCNFALIFFLEYVVSEPKTEETRKQSGSVVPPSQHTYHISWAIYQPFITNTEEDSFIDGVKLELDLIGGSNEAPEDVLVYRPEPQKKTALSSDSEKVEYNGNEIRLSAVFRKKVVDGKESIDIVKEMPNTYSEAPTESKIPSPVISPVTQVAPKELLTLKTQTMASKSDIYDAQIRQHEQLLKHQNMQQNLPIFLGKSSLTDEETMTHYTDIEPYVTPHKSNPSAKGQSGHMQPLQVRCHTGLGLSRAKYVHLYGAGFQDFVDGNGNSPLVIEPPDLVNDINWSLEENDNRDCDEIIFQFMALSRYDITGSSNPVKSVFFTLQFFKFLSVSTARVKLETIVDNISNYEASVPMILREINSDGSSKSDPPGTMLRFLIHPDHQKHGERYSYLDYLSHQVLFIDVWDGDSLMLIGSCAVNLKNMCRQGKASVQMVYELDIINQEEKEEGNISSLKGRLHLRMINIGSQSVGKLTKMALSDYRKKDFIVDATRIERWAGTSSSVSLSRIGGSLKDIYQQDNTAENTLSYSGIVLRPQRAITKHRDLAVLLDNQTKERGTGTGNNIKTPLMNENVLKGMNQDKLKKLSRLRSMMNNYERSETEFEGRTEDKDVNLQIIQTFREQQKKENIRLMLSGVIQKEIALYPKYGCTEIFEVKIKNHLNYESNIQIEVVDDSHSLAPVLNTFELRALKNLYSITTSSEDGLISMNKMNKCPEIFMRSKETVLVPFKYTNIAFQGTQSDQEQSLDGKSLAKLNSLPISYSEKQIIFRSNDGKLLSMVCIKIYPQPPALDQTFRFFHPEQSFFRKIIRLPPLYVIAGPSDTIKALTRCSDPQVVTECQQVPVGTPHDVFITVNCGPFPETRQFLVAVYLDKFLLQPIQVWHFTIQSQRRLDIVAYQGQPYNFALSLKRSSNNQQVQVFSSHPKELSFEHTNTTLTTNKSCELKLRLTPLKIGNRIFHANVVDSRSHKLVEAWSICAICKEPEVSKMFELEMPSKGGDECKKKVGYQNPYGYEKQFYLITDRQDLIMFKDTVLLIGPNMVEFIGLVFMPVLSQGQQKIFVFINDEDGKNEETFSILVNYV